MFENELNLLHSIFQLPKLNLFNQGEQQIDTNPLYPFAGNEQPGKEDKEKPADPEMVKQQQVKQQRETPPLPEKRPEEFGSAINGGSMPAPMKMPAGTVGDNPAMKAALMQFGLNLMTPQWGGELANLGMALGNAAQAYTRVKQSGQKDANTALATSKAEADIDATKALAEARRAAAETSKEKRLKSTTNRSTEFERLTDAMDIGPKGKLYLKEALKTLDEEDVLSDNNETIEQKYNRILNNARQLDGQALPNTTVVPKGGDAQAPYQKGDVFVREDGAELRLDGDDWQNQDNWTVIKEPPKKKKSE